MAANFIPHKVDGSSTEIFGNSAERAVVTGIVEGLPTTGNPEDVLWAAQSAVAAKGYISGSLYPGRTNCYLRTVQVFGVSHEIANVRIQYEPFEGVGTSVLIEIASSLSTFTTNKQPGTQKPFVLSWVPSNTTKYPVGIPPDYVPINMLRPMRRVAVTQLRAGTMTIEAAQSYSESVGYVNQQHWMNKRPGAWIVSGASASISKYGGYIQRRIEAMTQGLDLWSHYGILRSSQTGRYAGGDAGTADDLNDKMVELVSLPYAPKSCRYPAGNKTMGVCRVDPYDWTNFNTIFGFGAPSTPLGPTDPVPLPTVPI